MIKKNEVYLISDDTYYRTGVISHLKKMHLNKYKTYVLSAYNEMYKFTPSLGDVVIVAVHDSCLRQQIMKKIPQYCRTVLAFDLCSTFKIYTKTHPVIYNKKNDINHLELVIFNLLYSGIDRVNIPNRTQELLMKLGDGHSVSRLSEEYNISKKNIHDIKRRFFMRYGLDSLNALANLYCKEIIEWHKSLNVNVKHTNNRLI
ncbi:TPA: hypothetical protein LVM22_001081 [Klebsiella oxytoca]|nr:hypothetical protein [Klebsiella oxytoca]